ncbi:MAG: SusD/RagB family nutrient-binding outer membrane lipoprotein, partial [Bacteroidaceae bacterium]|nr:SusD/RagB family nutrient-binding outer membrane lipoprotein [Bacteroidaceae bacterium]
MKKKHILLAGSLLLGSFAMNSCLDFDDPGTELGINSVQTNSTQYTGNVDSIPYLNEIPFDTAYAVYEKLRGEQMFQTALGGIFSMRGSKDGAISQDHAYQMQYCLGTDGYAQYFVVPHRDFPYSEEVQTSTYNIAPKFNGGAGGVYSTTKLALMPLLNHP